LIRALLLAAALTPWSCSTPPAPPPVIPDGPAPDCDRVCAHIHDELGCMAGDCLRICGRIQRADFRACAVAATSCAEVTACGRPHR